MICAFGAAGRLAEGSGFASVAARWSIFGVAAAAVVLSGCSARTGVIREYLNPLGVSIADPQILHDGDTYYLYGTTAADVGFEVFTSHDLVHWRRAGFCYRKTADTWAQQHFWAPEVIRKGDTYYLFYTGYNPAANVRNTCIATASSPLGPFHDVTTPLLPPDRGFIDAHPFRDPDTGKYYVYVMEENVRPPQLWAARLSDDLLSLGSNLRKCISATQPWEHDWVEGPFVIKHAGTYYMTYSGFGYASPDYAVGIATAPSPLGPWTKYDDNPILHKTADVSGPGHNSLVDSPDGTELFIAYHRHLSGKGGWQRELAIDRMRFVAADDGSPRLVVDGPTHTPQPLPSGAAPYLMGRSDEFNAQDLDWSRWMSFGEHRDHWRIEGGRLCIDTQDGDLFQDRVDAKNIFLQYAPEGDFSVETQVDFAPQADFEQAFLLVWQDQGNYLKLATVHSGGGRLEAAWEVDGNYTSTLIDNDLGGILRFRIVKSGSHYDFFVAEADDGPWRQLGLGVDLELQMIRAGLGAVSPVSGAFLTARFDYLRLEPGR